MKEEIFAYILKMVSRETDLTQEMIVSKCSKAEVVDARYILAKLLYDAGVPTKIANSLFFIWLAIFVFSKSPQKVLLPGSNVFTRLSLKFWIILIYGLHHIFDIERRIRIRFIFFREKDVYIRCFQITQQRVYIIGFTILYPHNRVYSFPAGLFCNIIPTYALSLPHLF